MADLPTPPSASTVLSSSGKPVTGAGEHEPDVPPDPGPAVPLWRQRNFLLLWGGQTVSEMGSAVTRLALPLTAVVLLHAKTFQVGLLTAAATAAFALIALPAGVFVDRHAKRRIMIWCDAARLVIIGSIPVAAITHALSMAQLYTVAITAGACTVFFAVSYQSYLPELISRDQLMDGNGKLGATQAFAQVTGPGIGGGLVGLVGVAKAMGADALSYAVSVATLLAIRSPATTSVGQPGQPAGSGTGEPAARRRLRVELAEGLSFVLRHPILRKIVACTGTSNLFSGMEVAVQVVFLIRVLHVGPALVGVIFAVASVGGVFGGVLSGWLSARIGSARIIWFSFLVFGAPMLVAPLAAPGWGVVLFPIAMFAQAFMSVLYNVAQVSYRQAMCPKALLGRVNAAVRWIVWGTVPLGGLIGGALGAAIGVHTTLWIGFIGDWAAGFLVYFSPLRHMRDVPSRTITSQPRTIPHA